ncbi:Pre-mRNA polyadenylation factor FIP1 [Erysiphe neolycopersici]|uniref:Pre-mRNA polyadenylation factor FIP1 n=1 Tax=Erysiphe neolycopersici TaxID=212602 RepID=A0A420HUC8_9PEZI|nr:Pre-mRNA polyadenylation factor FIP1 [Erysiphe neolycopersici]
MEIDEDEDFYAPEESISEPKTEPNNIESSHEAKAQPDDGGLEEGEEEDNEYSGDSDIDIITERKDGTKLANPTHSRNNETQNIPLKTTSGDTSSKTTVKKASGRSVTQVSGADLPGFATSKIDVNAKPIYEPAGKPITQINIDEDLPENEKPWRRPGTDITDYFNYGFDEFSWALYASKQETVRSEYSADKIALNNKKLYDEMNMMMAMGAMPPIVPGGTGGNQIPGMEGIDMQAMIQQMVAAGLDPTQMDAASMFAAMQGSQGATSAGAGSQVGFVQGQNQYGFDQSMVNSGDRNRGGNMGRGRGRRGW